MSTMATQQTFKSTASSRSVAILTRVPMVSLTVIFTLIAFRYLINPVQAASEAGITFTSPGGLTVAMVGLGGLPLTFAAFFLTCLLSRDRLLSGLRTELMLLGIVIGVRVLGMAMAHSADTAKLLIPEGVLAMLCILAIRLETNRRNHEQLAPAS